MKTHRTCHYRNKGEYPVIELGKKINAFCIKDFCSAIQKFKQSGNSKLIIDLKKVEKAYPNGILPIICELDIIRDNSIEVIVNLPQKDNTRKLFRSVNWAHFLSPNQYEKSESIYDKHLVTRRFENPESQKKVVDDFMNIIIGYMNLPKDIISGLEWSINELTDNVLNHSNSSYGGLFQAILYPKEEMIAFAIADCGRGILKSMQEGFPELRLDIDAIGEAIKAGVTRNPQAGQGNGLAGSLRIATLSGGSFDITSGTGRLVITSLETKRKPLIDSKFNGTIICGQIKVSSNFSISDALGFDGTKDYVPLDIIDRNFEMEEKDCFLFKMKEENSGFGTRKAGIQLRNKVLNILNSKPDYPIIIDWDGIPVISSSFADEFIGKLFLEMGAMSFMARVKNKGMEILITQLLDKAIAQRLTQAKDE